MKTHQKVEELFLLTYEMLLSKYADYSRVGGATRRSAAQDGTLA